jgi:hypothetical protein
MLLMYLIDNQMQPKLTIVVLFSLFFMLSLLRLYPRVQQLFAAGRVHYEEFRQLCVLFLVLCHQFPDSFGLRLGFGWASVDVFAQTV